MGPRGNGSMFRAGALLGRIFVTARISAPPPPSLFFFSSLKILIPFPVVVAVHLTEGFITGRITRARIREFPSHWTELAGPPCWN